MLALGPAALSVWQLLLSLVAAGAVGWAMWRRHAAVRRDGLTGGRRGSVVVGVLLAAGLATTAWHLVDRDTRWEDWQQAGIWISAALAGAAGGSLGRHAPARRWAAALGCAAAVPLALEAVYHALVSHPMDVAFFEQHREALLAAQGMEPGSMPAVLYERRLRFSDATGAFGLANILASVAGTLSMLAVAVALVGWSGWTSARPIETKPAAMGRITAGGAGLAGLVTILLTGSKGAVVAAGVSAGVLAAVAVVRRLGRGGRGVKDEGAADPGVMRSFVNYAVPIAAVAVVLLAVVVTLGRGAIGPPEPPAVFEPGAEVQGERSLLFRSQYWAAAARMWVQDPVTLLVGVGPRGFAEGYLWAKDPLNPETVTSSHNVFVDYISMLGLGGVAWSVLLLLWLWRAGAAVGRDLWVATYSGTEVPQPRGLGAAVGRDVWAATDGGGEGDSSASRSTGSDATASPSASRVAAWLAMGSGVVLFGVCLLVQRGGLYLDTALLWVIAAAGYVGVAAVLSLPGRLPDAAVRAGLLAAAVFALLHNQVEMAFFQPGSVALLWLLVGVAAGGQRRAMAEGLAEGGNYDSLGGAGASPSHPALPSHGSSGVSGKPRIIVPALATLGLVATLLVMGVVTVRIQRHEAALASAATALQRGNLDAALRDLDAAQDAAGFDANALRWRVQLGAIEPMVPLVERGYRDVAAERVEAALGWINAAEAQSGDSAATARLRASLLDRWAMLGSRGNNGGAGISNAGVGEGGAEGGDEGGAADAAYARLAELSPHNVMDAMAWADLAARRGETQRARELYERVWRLRQQAYLDAADPLTPAQVQRLEAVLGAD